jgi:hypothetical protein
MLLILLQTPVVPVDFAGQLRWSIGRATVLLFSQQRFSLFSQQSDCGIDVDDAGIHRQDQATMNIHMLVMYHSATIKQKSTIDSNRRKNVNWLGKLKMADRTWAIFFESVVMF